jgi:hypothetical protein
VSSSSQDLLGVPAGVDSAIVCGMCCRESSLLQLRAVMKCIIARSHHVSLRTRCFDLEMDTSKLAMDSCLQPVELVTLQL